MDTDDGSLGAISEDAFDAIVIGSGSGGLTVAAGLAAFGKAVLLVESDRVGGDCTNVGCIPSKSLLHLASGEGDPVDILQSVRDRRDRLREEEADEFSAMDGVRLVKGRARLLGAERVEITNGSDRRIVSADHIVLATGSRPNRVDVPGLPERLRLTNQNLFELDRRPEHLAIVGGGPIGAEMAIAFRRLGSQVTVVEAAPRILPMTLPEAGGVVHRSLVDAGVEIHTGSTVRSFDDATGTLRFDGPLPEGHGSIAGVDAVLFAVGRSPNSVDLGLSAAGVTTDRTGRIEIDERGRTNVEGIWAVGDVTTKGGTTHAAGLWGRRVVRAIVAPRVPMPEVPPVPNAVFAEPELGWIGEQPERVRKDVMRLTVEFADVDRAFTDGVDSGLLVLDVRRLTGRILGATIVGPRAGELIGTVSLAMKAGVPLHKWYGAVWPYPTYADVLSKAVDAYMTQSLTSIPTQVAGLARGTLRRLFS